MAKKRPEIPHPAMQLVQAFEVFGYDEGQLLPRALGKSLQVKLDCITIAGIPVETRIALDIQTAFALATKITEIVFTLDSALVPEE